MQCLRQRILYTQCYRGTVPPRESDDVVLAVLAVLLDEGVLGLATFSVLAGILEEGTLDVLALTLVARFTPVRVEARADDVAGDVVAAFAFTDLVRGFAVVRRVVLTGEESRLSSIS